MNDDTKPVSAMTNVVLGATGIVLFGIMASIGMVMIPSTMDSATANATRALGYSYAMQIEQQCPSIMPQARRALADGSVTKDEIRDLIDHVRMARSLVGERRCRVNPVDLDDRSSAPLVLG